ncbi:MAG: hypothetical protein LBT74_08560 [Acidobacteriota bacterium]|jgi:hypothetical protein|nr:hypothetical protein [Acidobacteriota bacterium]
MKKPRFLLLLALLALAAPTGAGGDAAGADAGFFRVEDLRPGMKGVGKTCFQGGEPEEFEVEILGVLRGFSPGADAVLARFGGEKLKKVGVFSGMSGSPVFIDGKLLGAVAFSYSYSTEAVGGITPIAQMVAAAAEPEAFPSGAIYKKSRWGRPLPLRSSGGGRDGAQALPSFPALLPSGAPGARDAGVAKALLPISTPVNLGGFDPRTVDAFAPVLRQAGMTPVKGSGAGAQTPPASSGAPSGEGADRQGEAPFRPGDNIAVTLVEGDLDVSAGGTVTWVDGDRLYAFGHELLSLGFTELPMRKASAITVVPNLESSFKMLAVGETAGVIRQDRGAGVFGVMGERPRLTPLRVRLKNSRGMERAFSYDVARDALLTPVLVNLVLYNTIVSSERGQGALTVHVRGRIQVKGQPDVALDNKFSSDGDAAEAASLSVALPVNYLVAPGYEGLEIEGIDLDVTSVEKNLSASLESARLDRTEVRAGETVELTVTCAHADGTVARQSHPVKIPETVPSGDLSLLVADGATLTLLDDFESGGGDAPRDLGQLIRRMNEARKGDRLYVRLFRREAGAVLGGEGLPGLPPTILSILDSARETGSVGSLGSVALAEYELPPTEALPTGLVAMELAVKSK